MADAVMVLIGEAIAAEIAANAAAWPDLSFTPKYSYAEWDDALIDMNVLHVDVVPVKHDESELVARGRIRYTMSFDVALRMKPGIDGTNGQSRKDQLNRLVLFIEQLHEFFVARRLTTYEEAAWVGTKIIATSSRHSLRNLQMYLGIVRVSYQVTKVLA